jgi:hypothetical protein
VLKKAVFGVLYSSDCIGPSEAAVLLDSPPYYIQFKAKSLHDLATWIQQVILTPVIPGEINTIHAIRLLSQAVHTLLQNWMLKR